MASCELRQEYEFADEGLTQISVWSRGVLQNKEGRDIVIVLAHAAGVDGNYADAWENYVDLPDRVGVPLRSFARVSSSPIEMKYVYVNEEPDIVVVTDESLVKGTPVTQGMKPGGVLVVNTKREPSYILQFLCDTGNIGKLVCVDASASAELQVTLSGAEGATDATGLAKGWAAVLAGAVARATGIVSLDALKKSVARPELAELGFDSAVVLDLEEVGGADR